MALLLKQQPLTTRATYNRAGDTDDLVPGLVEAVNFVRAGHGVAIVLVGGELEFPKDCTQAENHIRIAIQAMEDSSKTLSVGIESVLFPLSYSEGRYVLRVKICEIPSTNLDI